MIKAKALKAGDTIGIIAPASPPRSRERIVNSVRYFEQLGYRVELGKHVADNADKPKLGYLAASDKDRLLDLHAMFRNKQVKAIFFHRGGFGSIRLLDAVDYDLVRKNPKIIVGYSDATSLFTALYKKARLASCFFGPMPGVDLWSEIDTFAEENMWRALTSSEPLGELPLERNEAKPIGKSGEAFGTMIGGNLTVFASLLGTPYAPSFQKCIPFFEEIEEKPRRIDAFFAQLRLAGLWKASQAVLLGQFTGCDKDADAPTRSLTDIFGDYFDKLDKPVVSGLPFGHEARKWCLPLGAKLRVSATKGKCAIEVLESPLS
jgi:muramoyltetrapeptide carboxypeptidase